MATEPRQSSPPFDAEPAEPDRAPAWQAAAEARRAFYRYRRQVVPWLAIAATYGVGVAAAAVSGGAAVLAVGAGWAAAGGAYGWVRMRRGVGRWDRVYAAAAAVGAACWLPFAAAFGPGGIAGAVLWLGGAAAALPWWIRNTEPDPDVTAELDARAARPDPEPEQAPPPLDWRAQRYGVYMGGGNKPLAGSRLAGITDIRFGWQATGELRRGEHWSQAAGQLQAIASIFDLPDGRVFVEPVPDEPVHRFRLTVLTSNPLIRSVTWPGPQLDPRTGTFPVAVTGDGEILPLRLWWPGAGTCHALVAGTTGSGKSGVLNMVLAEASHSDRLYPVLVDASGGQSLPDWLPHVPKKATNGADAKALLRWAEQVMRARNQHFSRLEWTDDRGRRRRGLNSVDPTPTTPGIVIVIDEAHELLIGDKDARRLVEQLTQMGRKTAISVVLATQVASVSQLGGSNVIRDMVKSGTVIALRTADRGSAGMVTDVPPPEPLNMLPREWVDGTPTHGLGYVMTARLIRSRTLHLEDPYEWAQAAPRKTLDPVSAAVPIPPSDGEGADGVTPDARRADLHVATSGGVDVAAQIRAALNAGTPRDDLPALVRATGLPPRAVKAALTRLD